MKEKDLFRNRLSLYEGGTKWLSFYVLYRFPISFVFSAIVLISYLPLLSSLMKLSAVIFSANVLLVVFRIIVYSDMLRMNSRGYKLNCVLLPIDAINTSVNSFFRQYESLGLFILIYLIIGLLLWWLPNYVYFKKRKVLFTTNWISADSENSPPDEKNAYMKNAETIDKVAEEIEVFENANQMILFEDNAGAPQDNIKMSEDDMCYCSKCGAELLSKESRFCHKCGNEIILPECEGSAPEPHKTVSTEQNTIRKGNEREKKRIIPIMTAIIVVVLIGSMAYGWYNYSSAIKSIDSEHFIQAGEYLDNMFIAEKIVPDKCAYVQAGILMESGNYLEALSAFQSLEDNSVPVDLIDKLNAEIYSEGQSDYRNDDLPDAKECFSAIADYMRSSDYLTLIKIKKYGSATSSILSSANLLGSNYIDLISLIGFEDTNEIIISGYYRTFLVGRWENGNIYFEMDEENYDTINNLPHNYLDGYYGIIDGIYSIHEESGGSSKLFKFTIIDADTISVYCYKDGSTYTLYRQ